MFRKQLINLLRLFYKKNNIFSNNKNIETIFIVLILFEVIYVIIHRFEKKNLKTYKKCCYKRIAQLTITIFNCFVYNYNNNANNTLKFNFNALFVR